MTTMSSGYDFKTFAVGIQIKPSIVERDDFIRSEFRLVGTYNVKSDITRTLLRQFSRRTKKIPDALDPDLTFTVNTIDGSCHVRTKSILLWGYYTKTRRGFPQKQIPCENCLGRGCLECDFHGIGNFDSVEGQISRMLFSKFDCATIKFTWIGGEDKLSLVSGKGRPFFARLQNPVRRHPRIARKISMDFVEIHNCKILSRLPRFPIKFISTIQIKVSVKHPLNSAMLRRLKSGLRRPVVVYDDSGRRSEKSVLCTRYRKISHREFVLTVDAEGGLPVKRFIEGGNITPSIGQIIENECKCVRFDFLGIHQ